MPQVTDATAVDIARTDDRGHHPTARMPVLELLYHMGSRAFGLPVRITVRPVAMLPRRQSGLRATKQLQVMWPPASAARHLAMLLEIDATVFSSSPATGRASAVASLS